MLREIAPDIWAIETPFEKVGINFGARMTVVRRKSGEIMVYAPFAISDEAEIRDKGEVRDIVAPNVSHFTEVGAFAQRFPDATLWTLSDIDKSLGDVRHRHLEIVPEIWGNDFECLLLDGMFMFREWVFCHKASRSLICTDLSFHLPPPRAPLNRIAWRLNGMARRFGTTRFMRNLIRLGDQNRVREHIRTILTWDFERIIPGHGFVIEGNGKERLRTAYSFLKV